MPGTNACRQLAIQWRLKYENFECHEWSTSKWIHSGFGSTIRLVSSITIQCFRSAAAAHTSTSAVGYTASNGRIVVHIIFRIIQNFWLELFDNFWGVKESGAKNTEMDKRWAWILGEISLIIKWRQKQKQDIIHACLCWTCAHFGLEIWLWHLS